MSERREPAPAAVALLAAAAFGAACFTHEVLGHAGACLLEGGVVTRLTSVYFHCRGGGVPVDLAGPGANGMAGMLAAGALRARRWGPRARVGLALAAAFDLFWVAGCLLASAIAATSDFILAARLAASVIDAAEIVARALLCVAGIAVGMLTCRMLSRQSLAPGTLRLAYGAAGLTACGLALCFGGPVAPALREAALESFGAMAWLWCVPAARARSHAAW